MRSLWEESAGPLGVQLSLPARDTNSRFIPALLESHPGDSGLGGGVVRGRVVGRRRRGHVPQAQPRAVARAPRRPGAPILLYHSNSNSKTNSNSNPPIVSNANVI